MTVVDLATGRPPPSMGPVHPDACGAFDDR
jgi:hypothetical protein